MMNLADYYAAMWDRAIPHLQANTLTLDPRTDDPHDPRRGITLIARPQPALQSPIQTLLDELRQLEPEQYYYPPTDQHVTILTPLSAAPSLLLSAIDVLAYVAAIRAALALVPAFQIEFAGLTISRDAVLLQGFPQDDTLRHLRERVRAALRTTALPHTLDQRYVLHTAHCTVLRFRAPLRRSAAFQAALERWRHRPLGVLPVSAIDLVYNDWYHRRVAVRYLASFPLRPHPERAG